VTERGVSTVADVSLALLLVAASLAVLVSYADSADPAHDAAEAEYTTETLLSSTVDVTYSVEPAVDDAHETTDLTPPAGAAEYDQAALRRVSHGPVVAHVGDAAVTNVRFGNDSLSPAAEAYTARLDEIVRSRLVNASFETHVSALWAPFGGESPIGGTAEVGPSPPAYEDVSATTVTVPSDIPAARTEAVAAVSGPDDFEAVARVVASAVVEGYLPEPASQRALESRGVDRALTVARYTRLHETLAPEAGPEEDSFEAALARRSANASRAKGILTDALTRQIEAFLEPAASAPPSEGPLGDAVSAAKQVTTGTVTVTIRTWE